jgi:hypothetical protein
VVGTERGKLAWRRHLPLLKLFRFQARTLSQETNDLRCQHLLLRHNISGCQPNEQLTSLNPLPLANKNASNHTTIAMLYRLTLARNNQIACCVGCCIEASERSPTEKNDKEERGSKETLPPIGPGIRNRR